jgi:hypothetical protein
LFELNRDRLTEHRNGHNEPWTGQTPHHDATAILERPPNDTDRITKRIFVKRDEGGALGLQAVKVPEFLIQQRLILDLEDANQKLAAKRRLAVYRGPPEENVTRKEGQIGSPPAPGSQDFLFELRQVETDAAQPQIPRQGLLLAASRMGNPPGLPGRGAPEEVRRKVLLLTLQKRHD